MGPGDWRSRPDGRLLVADTANNRIQRFSSDGNLIDVIGGPGSGPGLFAEPVGVALDTAGRIYVADRGNRRIQQLDPDGTYLQEWPGPEGGFGALADIDAEGDVLYALDRERGLARLDPGSGASTWLSPTDGEGRIMAGTGLAVRDGRAYVADAGAASVLVFDEEGALLEQWPVAAWSADPSEVADVEVDQDGTVWATDPANDAVVVFDSSRSEVGRLTPGDPDTLDGPAGIALRPAGSLFVANFDGNRISLLTQTHP